MMLVPMALEEDGRGPWTAREAGAMAQFCAAKCDDASSAASALRSLQSLLAVERRDESSHSHHVAILAASLVLGNGVHVPAHAQKTRQHAWELVDVLLRYGRSGSEAEAVMAALQQNGDAPIVSAVPVASSSWCELRFLLRQSVRLGRWRARRTRAAWCAHCAAWSWYATITSVCCDDHH